MAFCYCVCTLTPIDVPAEGGLWGSSFPASGSCCGFPKYAHSSSPAKGTAQYTHARAHTVAGVRLRLHHQLQTVRILLAWYVIWSQRPTPAPCFNGTRCIYTGISVQNRRALWKCIPSSPPLLALWFAQSGGHRAHEIDSSRLKNRPKKAP